MWLVLAETGDDVAAWVAEGLAQRGVRPVRVVTGQELATATVWEHRIQGRGVCTRLRFADGDELGDIQLQGVLNRLGGFYQPPGELSGDGEYAACEWNALVLSWLAFLPCPVLNRPSPDGGLGGYRSPGGWRYLAHRAGLPIAPLIQSNLSPEWVEGGWDAEAGRSLTVFVVAGDVVAGCDGSGDAAIEAGCARLSRLAGDAVLAVHFTDLPGQGMAFCWATQQPDLRLGDSALLDLLAGRLR
jgi:hypothetical protein